MSRLTTLLAAVTVLLVPWTTLAQQGDLQVGGGAAWIEPDVRSGSVLDTGTRLELDGSGGLSGTLRWWLSGSLALGASIGASEHDLETAAGLHGGLDAGSLWLLPVAATLQYHLRVWGPLHPYGGVGVAWAWVPEADPGPELLALGIDDLDVSASPGPALIAGVETELGRRFSVHLEVRYTELSTDAELLDLSGNLVDEITLDLDPWALVLGGTWRY